MAHPAPRDVATLTPNAWGLFDFHGSVLEWCEDAYHPSYKDAPTDGTAWTEGGLKLLRGTGRVFRGGGYNTQETYSRSSARLVRYPGAAGSVGFRPAFTLPPEE